MHSVDKSVGLETGQALQTSIASATRALLDYRQPDGHWAVSYTHLTLPTNREV